MAHKLVKASALAAVFAGAALTTACSPSPPPPHNEYNITMHCIGRPTEKFNNVSLWEGATLYHVRKFNVVNDNQLELAFEKNFRKFGCTMERELAPQPAAAASAPSSP